MAEDTDRQQANLRRMARVIEMTPFMKHLRMEFLGRRRVGEAGDALPGRELDGREGAARGRDLVADRHDGGDGGVDDCRDRHAKYFGSTVGINVNYLSAAIGEDIFAEGRILKRGKEIIYSDVRVTNGEGKLLAQGTVTYRIIERE